MFAKSFVKSAQAAFVLIEVDAIFINFTRFGMICWSFRQFHLMEVNWQENALSNFCVV